MKHYGILILDNEEYSAAMLANRLELNGFSCRVRNDGRTAIDIVEYLSFSRIILDLRLPVINGSEEPVDNRRNEWILNPIFLI